jgi:hypothetical protein
MNMIKGLGILAVLLAIVGAFVTIPYLAAILVVLGLIGGVSVAGEDHVRVIVSALALTGLAGVLSNIPTIGQYLNGIVANLGLMVAGAAIIIILGNVYRRFKP